MVTNDENEIPASLGARRNIKHLPPIQTSFVQNAPPVSRWRRARPVAPDQSRVPLSPAVALKPIPAKPVPKIGKRQSKMSLFNLFSRPNVEKARGHHESGLSVPIESPTLLVADPPPPKPLPVIPIPSPPRPQPERTLSKSQKGSVVKRSRQPINWDPPPLFQAYPQSIKHATLQACTASPDVLIRTHTQRQQYHTQQQKMESNQDLSSLDGDTESKKPEKGNAAHKRLISASIMNPPDLTTKVYVLVTSGFVLQYAGEGPSDRLPEKILHLGTESAAFACDLIPGKHWVLQISQSAKEDGTVSTLPSRSLLSRLRLQNSTARRNASSFFLIMESAEEMDAWLTAVRREIDALGGMKCRVDSVSSTSTEPTEEETQLRHRPSHRYMVHRDPDRFGSRQIFATSPVQSPIESPVIVAQNWEGSRQRKPANSFDAASTHSSKHTSVRQSAETSSIATTGISNDQLQLNQMRESSRLSYVSSGTSGTGTMTVTTSLGSSPATSPRVDTFEKATAEPPRAATSLRSFHMNPSAVSTNRRRSMQTLPTTNEDHSFSTHPRAKAQRHSTWGPPQGQNQPEVHIPASAYFNRHRGNLNSSPVKSNPGTRSSSAPPARAALITPTSESSSIGTVRPPSTLGDLPNASTLPARSRLSATPKPFFRPLPIRTQDASGPVVIPRRFSSLGPPPSSIAAPINHSASTPATLLPPPSALPQTQVPSVPPQSLRRPMSMQIRADRAPFLSSSRPTAAAYNRSVPTTASYPSANRSSSSLGVHSTAAISVTRARVQNRKSMPVMGLPPPAPPPNMPLPPPPPATTAVHV